MKNYCLKLVAVAIVSLQVLFAGNVLAVGPDASKPYILITPYLSSTVITNNRTLAVKANVDSNFPITKGYAVIEGFSFQIPLALEAGTDKSGFWLGLWQTSGLADKEYSVAVTFIDSTGHSWTDRSVTFTDPIAGVDTAGNSFGVNSYDNKIISQKITFDEDINQLNAVKVYINNSEGLFRIGLYNSQKELLWQSEVIQNSYNNEWLEIPISNGTPSEVGNLPKGDYFISAQSILSDNMFGLEYDDNSELNVQNYLFNAFPRKLDNGNIQNLKLSAYVIYNEQYRFVKKIISSFLSWFE